MKVITTANNIGQAFKNAARVREILAVLAGHGFADLLYRMKLSRFLPKRMAVRPLYQDTPFAVRLRSAFEELGPTFVKLGQLLAARSDLIPEAFCKEFEQLQDNVSAVNFSEIKKFVEAEFHAPLTEIFADFNAEPIAAASIAQVHAATLKSGEKVAVKIQRPGIEKIIQNDISILQGFAALLERYIPESRSFNPTGLVDEFFHSILYELDFQVEANNIRRIKKNLASLDKVAVPVIYSKYCTHHILTMERFEGIRFSDRKTLLERNIAPMEIVNIGAEAFFHMVMHDGLFHGDLHAGNLFVLSDGRIGIVDFGIVGRLSRKMQDSVMTMFIALVNEDYEALASEYANVCPSTAEVEVSLLQKDLMDTISPYVGMPLGEVNVGRLLLRSTSLAVRHHLQVPKELMLLFKAMFTVEALGKQLEPDFDILEVGHSLARKVLVTRYSKERIQQDLLVTAREIKALSDVMPRLLRRFVKTWSQNQFAWNIRNKDTENLARQVHRFSYIFSMVWLSCALLIMAIAMWSLHPINQSNLIASVCSVIALLIPLLGMWSIRKA